MRFGIDFGTTRTVIAVVDRGNYPVVNVTDTLGDPREFIPSVVALSGPDLVAGWEAELKDTPAQLRSFKRLLSSKTVTADTPIAIGDEKRPLGEILHVFAEEVARSIRTATGCTEIEAMLGVPANAGTAQRLLTLDAFARAGVKVLGLVNEPSAAAFEYTHRHSRTFNSKRSEVIVYDLGGGTFDATLLKIDDKNHEVQISIGISRLGGDDFDEVLVQLALSEAGRDQDVFGRRARQRIVEEARTAKEQLKPQSRRIVLEIGEEDVILSANDFYEASMPLVERTLEAMAPLVGASGSLTDSNVAGIYLVGGASALPSIPRRLREEFGRRVHRSTLPTASTALGLAIAADPDSGYQLNDRLARGIGVFRELENGTMVSFDTLVQPGEVTSVTRRYRAVHNVGWFRYVDYSALTQNGTTPGDFTLIKQVVFPFLPELRALSPLELAKIPVQRFTEDSAQGIEIEETVQIDERGIASISLRCVADGFELSSGAMMEPLSN